MTSATNNSSSSPYSTIILPVGFPFPLSAFNASFSIVASITGAVGNILIWLALMQTTKLKTATNFFVAHLALSDLGNCVICFPTFIPALMGNDWLFLNIKLCKAQFYLACIFSCQSALTLNVIALNRYCLVAKKLTVYRKIFSRRATAALVTFMWAIDAVVLLLPEMGVGNVVPVPSLHTCMMEPGDPASWLIWTLLICLSFLLCYLAIPIFYFLTFSAAKKSKQKVMDHVTSVIRSVPASSAGAQLASQSVERTRQNCKKDELRFTVVSALVYLTFTLCWTPLCVVHLINWSTPVPAWLYHWCFLLIYTNSCLNPFIYAGLNRNFKRKIKQLLRLEVN